MPKILASFIILTIFLIFSPRVFAQEYYFQEEFNQERPTNTLDSDKWTVYPNAASGITTIHETGGNLLTSQANNTPRYPLITSKNQILPEGNFSAEIKFQYTSITRWGTGIAFAEEEPSNGGGFNALFAITIWQDSSWGPNMRIQFGDSSANSVVYTLSTNTNPHILKIDHVEQKYLLYLDGNLIFTSPNTEKQAKYIWLGNPTTQNPPVPQWTSFNVDYIRVLKPKTPLVIIPGIAASSNWKILTDKGDSGWDWMVSANSSWRQFLDSLEKAGYQKDKDYFIAFYDWRKTNDWTDPDPGAALPAKKYLSEAIDKAKTANPGVSKVNIVAHSMGGLVTKSYIESPNYRGDVNKAFLIGSPNAGSTFAYYAWEGGEIPPNWDPIQKAGLSIMIKMLSINFLQEPYHMIHDHIKSIKDLLPVGYNYLSKNNNIIDWTSMLEINNFLKNTSNPQNTASIFTNKGVGLINITGTGQTTWEKLAVEDFTHQYLWKDGKPLGEIGTADGDNTVLTSSSNLPGAEQLTVSGKHANLPNAATPQIFNKLGITYTPSYLAGAPDEVMVAWVASPVDLKVLDSLGNSVGELLTDPETDKKWVFVENPTGDYNLNLTGTGAGEYHVGVDYYTDTKTESSQTQGTAVSGAQLDYNLHLNPQNPQPIDLQPEDKIAPTTTAQLSGTVGKNNWYLSNVNFSLSTTDNENGSGIDKTQYSFDNTTWQKYEAPLIINNEGKTIIYFRSSDLVGNLEQTKQIEIKIDKTAPEAKISVNSDKDDLEILGIDQNQTTVQRTDNTETKKKDDAIYIITDEVGNSLKLDIRERDKEKQDRFRIYSLQYNNNPVQVLENNHFNVSYEGKKDKLNIKEQNFEQKGEIKIQIKYDVKKNKSTIMVKESKVEKVKEIMNGLVILQLITNKGLLETIY